MHLHLESNKESRLGRWYMETGHKHSYAVDFHYLAQIERKSLKFLMKKLFSFVSGSVIAIAIAIAIAISIVISVVIVIFDIVVIVVAALIFYLNFVFCLHFLATCSHIVNNKPRQSELSWTGSEWGHCLEPVSQSTVSLWRLGSWFIRTIKWLN